MLKEHMQLQQENDKYYANLFEINKNIENLRNLKDGWDGENACPIKESLLEMAISITIQFKSTLGYPFSWRSK